MFKQDSSGPVEILRYKGSLDAAVAGPLRKLLGRLLGAKESVPIPDRNAGSGPGR